MTITSTTAAGIPQKKWSSCDTGLASGKPMGCKRKFENAGLFPPTLVTTPTLAEEYSQARLLEDCESYEDLRRSKTSQSSASLSTDYRHMSKSSQDN